MSIHARQLDYDYVYPRKIDFVQIIEDIKDYAGTYSVISEVLGTGWSTLQRWRKGAEPGFTSGTGLLMVHAQICGPELTQQRVEEAEI